MRRSRLAILGVVLTSTLLLLGSGCEVDRQLDLRLSVTDCPVASDAIYGSVEEPSLGVDATPAEPISVTVVMPSPVDPTPVPSSPKRRRKSAAPWIVVGVVGLAAIAAGVGAVVYLTGEARQLDGFNVTFTDDS